MSMENGREIQLLVYQEGYALYRVGKYTTVFPVHSCGDYCYENDGQQICVDASFFEQQEWYVRLFLEGEDRLTKNRETCHKRKVFSYHAVSEECFFLSSPALPPLEQLIKKRADFGIDGTSDRKAKRYCNPVFLLWGNTVGDCKGTWHYTAHGFSDACGSASPDAGQSERQSLWKESGFQRGRCAVCGVNVQRSGDVMYFAQVMGLWWK